MKPLHTLILATALAISVPAQATIVVGPSGLPTINDAIAVANDGDVIVIEPGTYTTFYVFEKSLTIRAMTPGTVTISGGFLNLAFGPSQTMELHLVGINLRSIGCAKVWLTMDECSTQAPNGLSLTSSTCHLQRCRIAGTDTFLQTAAIHATDSIVTAVDTVIEGAVRVPPVSLTRSSFLGSRLQILSGPALGPAVVGDAESSLWLADSQVTGDPASCPLAVADGRTFRTTLSPDCGAPPTGLVLGVRAAEAPKTGAPLTLGFTTRPFHPVAVFGSRGLATTMVAQIEQAISLDLGQTFFAGLVVANAQGSAVATWNIPASPALVDTTLWLQGFSGLTFPLQASAVAGGVIR